MSYNHMVSTGVVCQRDSPESDKQTGEQSSLAHYLNDAMASSRAIWIGV